jgi:hypothetical protein
MKPVLLFGFIISAFLSLGSCRNTDEEFLPLPPLKDGYYWIT